MHDASGEDLAAVGAWHADLQRGQPRSRNGVAHSPPRQTRIPPPLFVVLPVIRAAAVGAIRELPRARVMELPPRLPQAARGAAAEDHIAGERFSAHALSRIRGLLAPRLHALHRTARSSTKLGPVETARFSKRHHNPHVHGAVVRPDRMAVRAYNLALGDLGQDVFAWTAAEPSADLAELHRAGQVIPLHEMRRVDPSAVGAGPTGLEGEQPAATASIERPGTWDRVTAMSLIQLVIDQCATLLAIRLTSVAPPSGDVELGQRLRLATFRAALRSLMVQMFDTVINSERALFSTDRQ